MFAQETAHFVLKDNLFLTGHFFFSFFHLQQKRKSFNYPFTFILGRGFFLEKSKKNLSSEKIGDFNARLIAHLKNMFQLGMVITVKSGDTECPKNYRVYLNPLQGVRLSWDTL